MKMRLGRILAIIGIILLLYLAAQKLKLKG